jgi:mRNA interferase MazF
MVPYPFPDLSGSKRRSVLSLTAADAKGDFIACPITSSEERVNARQLLSRGLTEGALPLASWVRTDRVVTLHTGLNARRFGRTSEAFRNAAANEVCRYIGAIKAE